MPSEAVAVRRETGWGFRAAYRFGRFSAVSFSLMTVLAGAATADPGISLSLIAGLTIIGIAFHLFAYIHNDVCDLPIDRSEPLRQDSPLVMGMIEPKTALAVAFAQVPLALGMHLCLGGGFRPGASLAAAFILLCVYNKWGKRVPMPIVSDFVQAAGWLALATYGALISGRPLNTTTETALALIFVYVLMINGVHGGIRDLDNDFRCGAQTTAILLGASPDAGCATPLPSPLLTYAFALHGLLIVILALYLGYNVPGYDPASRIGTAAIVLGVFAAIAVQVGLALRRSARASDRTQAGLLHLVISLGLLYWPFALYFDLPARIALLAVYAIPVTFMCIYDGIRGGLA